MRIEPEWLDYSINQMYRTFGGLTVAEVAERLDDIGCQHNTCGVEVLGGRWYEIEALLSQPVHRSLARYIHVKFFGGPPRHEAVYKGTLITMLIDRLMTRSIYDTPNKITETTSN
jgi:hypothetical protein